MLLIETLSPLLLKVALAFTLLLIVMVTIRKYFAAKKIINRYYESIEAVQFLLAVEDIHCQNNKAMFDSSGRNTVRQQVSLEQGIEWTGRFSQAKIRKEKFKIKNIRTSFVEPLDKLQRKLFLGLCK